MLILNELVVNSIYNNLTLRNMMGATSSDKRIYTFGVLRDIVFDNNKKAAILFKIGMGKRPSRWSYPTQYPNASIFLRVQSSDPLLREQICDELLNVFDVQINSLYTDDVLVKWSELVSRNDGIIEGTPTKPIHTKNITFMFKEVFSR